MKLLSSYPTWTIVFTQVTSILLPTDLSTERCRNCLDGKCKKSGQCTKGCIVGFADKYCQHKCQSTCKDNNCQLDEDTGKIICLFGCEDGFCGQQCKAPCEDGCLTCDSRTCTCSRCNGTSYGNTCQHSCLHRCVVCDNTGQCLSCRHGRYGRNCENKCGSKCTRCKLKTGKCIKCQQGFHGDSCDQVSTVKTREIQSQSTPSTYHRTNTSSTSISTSSSQLVTTSSEPEGTQLFSGLVGTVIAVLLFVLVALKLRFLCRRTAVTLTGDHQDDVQHGVVELLEVPQMVHPGPYCEINEDEMDPEMPVLADCFHNRASSDREMPDDVMDNASNYEHLHNIDPSKLEYLSPSD